MTMLEKSTHPYTEGESELGIPRSHVERERMKKKEKEVQIITPSASRILKQPR